MAFSADSIRDTIRSFVEIRKADADQQGIALPEDLKDTGDVVITTHQEVEHGESSVLNDLREGFKKNMLSVVDTGIHDELKRLQGLDKEERKKAVKDFLKECLDKSFELFWGTLESMCRLPDELDPQNPEDYLAFNEDVALACIETVREHEQGDGAYKKIDSQIETHHKLQRKPITFFRGASVPDTFPLFEKFADLCSDNDVKYGVFGHLYEGLNKLVSKITDGKQKGYPVSGVLQGWIEFFTCINDNYRTVERYTGHKKPVITTQHEYFSMLQRVGRPVVVTGDSENEIASSIFSELMQDSDDKYKRRVVLISSVHRDGQRVDVNKIMSYVLANFPDICFVIDAAQDHVLYPDAHCVIYGKRFGGTGTGIIMLNRKNLPEEVIEAYHFDSGFNTRDLAHTFAAVRCEFAQVHFANDFRDLLTSENLWRFKGGGTYIDKQVEKISNFIKTREHLNDNFEVVTSPDPVTHPAPWKSSRVISFKKRPGSRISIESIAKHLYEEKKIQVDWFSLEALPEYRKLLAMASGMPMLSYSSERCAEFIYALARFQNTYFNYIIDPMLLLPELFNGEVSHEPCTMEELCKRQADFLNENGKRQEMIRILVDIRMAQDDIDSFLEAFNDAVLQTDGKNQQ